MLKEKIEEEKGKEFPADCQKLIYAGVVIIFISHGAKPVREIMNVSCVCTVQVCIC